jgi:ribosomal-protein-alanine N-acetyltransferase
MPADRYDIDENIYITQSISEADVPSLVKYLNNPTIYANTAHIPSPYTLKDAEDFIQRCKTAVNDSYIFTVRLNENDEMIGACGIHSSKTNKRIAEVGFWLGEPYWRRGFMSRVVRKVLEIIKAEFKHLVRIQAQVFTWNTASKRVIETCGFAYEGLLRRQMYKDGKDVDVYLYAFIIE